MIFSLMLRGLRTGKARFACAALGVAVATGSLVFTTSFLATSNAQAPRRAAESCAPFAAWQVEDIRLSPMRRGEGKTPEKPRREARRKTPADLSLKAVALSLDYRPGGRVMQGPPMRVLLAEAPASNVYGRVALAEGRWVDESSPSCEVVCVRSALQRFGHQKEPPLFSSLKFVGEKGTMTAQIVGYLDGDKLPREFPTVFANEAALRKLASERFGSVSFFKSLPSSGAESLLTPQSESVLQAFRTDDQKRLDYARPVLLLAAFLTALALLVNALDLSVEASRPTLAMLRVAGATRWNVVAYVFDEAFFSSFVGWLLGVGGAIAALGLYVFLFPQDFPLGLALDGGKILLTFCLLPVLVLLALLFALAPALRVRALDIAARRRRSKTFGMALAFGFGFASFVAVEVWGATLMRAFVPSPEWPDAIVSFLPGGVSSYDVEKLRSVEGVRRLSELVPRQLFFERETSPRNALFLGAEFLPRFRFAEGTWEEANEAVFSGRGVVISSMLSRAHGLHVGDVLRVFRRGRRGAAADELAFPIVGVADVNWHMVTSRGLVRGLNGAPGMTDGPVFCSLDTMGLVDPRTYMTDATFSAPMTHVWVDYDKGFLAEKGVFQAGRLIESEIARRLDFPEGATVRLHARDEIADGTLAHGDDLIGQVARVPFVFLAILSLGFVAMLVARADASRETFALLRAVGATRLQRATRLAMTAVKTALIGILLALPVGFVAGWLFARKTGALWPGLPSDPVVPWGVILEGACGALVFALLVAVPTSLYLIGRDSVPRASMKGKRTL